MQTQGLWDSLITKVINNLQITIKNIHVRYEDNISVPGVSRIDCVLSNTDIWTKSHSTRSQLV